MPRHPVIVTFVSQKGGTGKSTLLKWEKLRSESQEEPSITVEGFDTAADAIASAESDELLIIDAPAHANRGTLEIAQAATLIVQPSGASLDDLRAGGAALPRACEGRHHKGTAGRCAVPHSVGCRSLRGATEPMS
jgi:hypothetical protein